MLPFAFHFLLLGWIDCSSSFVSEVRHTGKYLHLRPIASQRSTDIFSRTDHLKVRSPVLQYTREDGQGTQSEATPRQTTVYKKLQKRTASTSRTTAKGGKSIISTSPSSISKKKPNKNGAHSVAGLHDELERYRNRAILTEAVLKEKVKDLKVTQAKVEVLEETVEKLKNMAEGDIKWKDRHDSVLAERDMSRESLELRQRDWDRTAESWVSERQKLKDDYEVEKKRGEEDRRLHEESEGRLKTKLKEMNEEILSMENAGESMEIEIENLVTALRREQSQRDEILQIEREKVSKIRKELIQAKQERDRVLEKAEKQGRQYDEEAIEIAKASAAAAARRETAIQAKYEDLRSKYEWGKQENRISLEDGLSQKIEELNEQIRSLKKAHGAELQAERRASEKRIAEVVEQYHRQMQRARNDFVHSNLEQAPPPKEQGVWQRIRRRFRK